MPNQTIGKGDEVNVEDRLSAVENNLKQLREEIDHKNKALEAQFKQNKELLIRIQEMKNAKVEAMGMTDTINDHCPVTPPQIPDVESIQERLENVLLDTAAAQADIVELKRFEKELDHLKREALERDHSKDQAQKNFSPRWIKN